MAQQCPTCKSYDFFIVATVREYHTMEALPDENGNVDLCELEDTCEVDSVPRFILCASCGIKTDLQGNPL